MIPVSFPAEEGATLELPNASWFVPDTWVGPLVVGWSGCLEAFRFAFDPTEGNEYFYFDADPMNTATRYRTAVNGAEVGGSAGCE